MKMGAVRPSRALPRAADESPLGRPRLPSSSTSPRCASVWLHSTLLPLGLTDATPHCTGAGSGAAPPPAGAPSPAAMGKDSAPSPSSLHIARAWRQRWRRRGRAPKSNRTIGSLSCRLPGRAGPATAVPSACPQLRAEASRSLHRPLLPVGLGPRCSAEASPSRPSCHRAVSRDRAPGRFSKPRTPPCLRSASR